MLDSAIDMWSAGDAAGKGFDAVAGRRNDDPGVEDSEAHVDAEEG